MSTQQDNQTATRTDWFERFKAIAQERNPIVERHDPVHLTRPVLIMDEDGNEYEAEPEHRFDCSCGFQGRWREEEHIALGILKRSHTLSPVGGYRAEGSRVLATSGNPGFAEGRLVAEYPSPEIAADAAEQMNRDGVPITFEDFGPAGPVDEVF